MSGPNPRRRKPLVAIAALATVAVLLAAGQLFTTVVLADARPTAPLAPLPGEPLFGVQLDWAADTPASYAERLGRDPAVYGEFVAFPFTPATVADLDAHVAAIAARRGAFLLTLEPFGGLDTVDAAALELLTGQLLRWNEAGVPVIVRFAHEMNGSWYPWGQRPGPYIETFRRVATAVHRAPAAVMLWSPNDRVGYPFAGGAYEARPGTTAFAALDTNDDGQLSLDDDAYGPYYPGDAYVDWVGLSLYHFGTSYPWGENEVPEADKFVAKITGTDLGDGRRGEGGGTADFYATFAERRGKPMAISETAALYNTAGGGATENQIKSAWWSQLFDDDVPSQFPNLGLVLWFEHRKQERDVPDAATDWRATADPTLRDGFRAAMPPWFRFAEPVGAS